jgi:hypothetical protein
LPTFQTQGRAVITPLGIVYNTSMTRPDAALALSALYSSATRGGLRVGAVCVTGAGFQTAVFCEAIARFYQPRVGGSNTTFPVGLTDAKAPDSPMIRPVLDRKKDGGEAQYVRTIQRVADTSLAEALIRNGVTLTTQGAIVLSAPATSLARTLAFPAAVANYKRRIRRLVIVETVERQDAAALAKLVAEWPTPIYLIGTDIGTALTFPGARLGDLFSWTPAHPAADAYKAFKPMPYDAPLHDVAAVQFAITPDADYFALSEPGNLSVAGDGALKFNPGAGQVRKVTISQGKRQQALDALIAMATMAPQPSALRGTPTK